MDAEARAANLERWRLRAILLGLGVAGIFCNILSSYLWGWLEPIAKELGTALIVSAVLGATVDFFFKGELARNAFLAAFRYVLPGEFKEEVAKILAHPFVSNDHIWKVKIEKVNETVTLVTTMVERKIANRTSSDQERGALYTIPEYDYENGPSEILECAFEMKGKRSRGFKTERHEDWIEATTEKFKIKPNETAKISVKAKQYRRTNDSMWETFLDPIIKPVIEVIIDNAVFGHKVEFGTNGYYEESKFDNKYTLDAVYFPGQYMHVRWWPKKTHPESPETVAGPMQ